MCPATHTWTRAQHTQALQHLSRLASVASNPVIDPPIIWRTKLRSLKPGVDHAKQIAYCIDGGRVGIGWGVEDLPTGTRLPPTAALAGARHLHTRARLRSVRLLRGQRSEVGDRIDPRSGALREPMRLVLLSNLSDVICRSMLDAGLAHASCSLSERCVRRATRRRRVVVRAVVGPRSRKRSGR
jgi:hypothetical protein